MLNRRRLAFQIGGDTPGDMNGHRQVEYIESAGCQYIDTGIVMLPGYRIECEIAFTSNANDQYYGVIENTANSVKSRVQFGSSNGKLSIYCSPSYSNIYTIEYDADKHMYALANDTACIDGEGILSKGGYPEGNLYLFACNNAGVVDMFTYSRCYGCQVYDGDENLIADFIPCVRQLDNKPGMYDPVSNVFYVNSGADEFMWG